MDSMVRWPGASPILRALPPSPPPFHGLVDGQVLMAASVAGLEVARGYGVKPGFFGPAPYLEVAGGQVVAGEGAILKAIALVRTSGLQTA